MTKTSEKFNILLIGCGKMGSAMAQGWMSANMINALTILDPAPLPSALSQSPIITHITAAEQIADTPNVPDFVLIAVKPQMMKQVCLSVQPFIPQSAALISIAAGTPIALFEEVFGDKQPVIRTMPNTPAAIGQGITAAMPNTNTSQHQKDGAARLLGVSGQLQWVEDEELFHAITALSGSGPAYIFLLIETMTKAGIEIGLAPNIAETLARQTVIGSAALAGHESNTSASQLRQNVTSPGGTTQAALHVLMDGRLDELYKEALKAAKDRSTELSKA